jgi:hypothetical protein
VRNLVASRVPLADLIFIVSGLQGLEYILRSRAPMHGLQSSPMLNAIEAALPFWAWGSWLLIPSLVGLFCLRLKVWRIAVIMHALAAGAYVGLCSGIIVGVVHLHQWWGWNSAPAYAGFAIMHALWAVVDVLREHTYDHLVKP